MSALIRIQFSHFTPENARTHQLYNLDRCERCGEPMKAANAMTAHNVTAATLRKAGLVMLDCEPPEGYWSEEFGGACCEPCCDAARTVHSEELEY